jgi:hypothetical protein
MDTQKLINHFEIPDELARELDELLTTQIVRERLLVNLVGDSDKYATAEQALIQTVSRIEFIKKKITREYVPDIYRFPQYVWNYDGYSIDGNKVQILETVYSDT